MQDSVQSISLSSLLGIIKESVDMIFSDSLWVTAELLSISGNGHKYLDLVEYDDRRQEAAKSRAMIWRDDTRMLVDFKKATGIELSSGMKILFKAKPAFHPVYGLSLTIQAIDPTFTLGDMEARLMNIRDDLKKRGWWDLNRSLPKPVDYCKVAVIAPADAAGLGDFRVYADRLEELGLCRFSYYPSLFQGPQAIKQIIEQMVTVFEDNKSSPFDALAIIRGGGDKAGLYQLNDHRLAAYICRFPLPVLVGIGHERDSVLIDEVAHGRFSTPSMLISHIVQHIVDQTVKAQRDWDQIRSLSKATLSKAESDCRSQMLIVQSEAVRKLESARNDALSYAQGFSHALGRAQTHIDRLSEEVCRLARGQLDQAMIRVENHMADIMTQNPLTHLHRGYAILKSDDGYITSSAQVEPGQHISVRLKDGTLSTRVSEVNCEQQ